MSGIGEQIRRLHQSGVRSTEIARQLEVAQATVHYHLRRPANQASDAQPAPEPAALIPPSAIRTRELVAQLLAQGVGRAAIAKRLGITKGTVSYHARRLGARIDERCRRRYDWVAIQVFYDAGHSMRECRRAFGFSSGAWHDAVLRGAITPRPPFCSPAELFAAGTPRNRGHLKSRLMRLGLKHGHCERCGIDEWHGRSLALSLHHINGIRDDNRLENLELLCPNCHSQTENFAGRNRPGPGSGAVAHDASRKAAH